MKFWWWWRKKKVLLKCQDQKKGCQKMHFFKIAKMSFLRVPFFVSNILEVLFFFSTTTKISLDIFIKIPPEFYCQLLLFLVFLRKKYFSLIKIFLKIPPEYYCSLLLFLDFSTKKYFFVDKIFYFSSFFHLKIPPKSIDTLKKFHQNIILIYCYFSYFFIKIFFIDEFILFIFIFILLIYY